MSVALGVYRALPVFAQNAGFTAASFWRERSRFTRHFHLRLKEWERTVHGPLDALHAVQRRRLDALVDRARRHVPFYRDLPPPSRAIDPVEAIAETLAGIPALEKQTYRERHPELLAADLSRALLRRGQTSGTTGKPLPLWHTRANLAEEYAAVWRSRRALGISLMDPHLSFAGQTVVPFSQTRPPFWRQSALRGHTYFSLYHMTRDNLRGPYVRKIHATRACYAQGYPSSLHLVGLALLEEGRPLPQGRLRAVFTSSETLLAFQREVIEKAFNAPVRDRYGVSELAASMTSCALNRLHVDMEYCIVEVEPEEENDEWVRGPLVVTGLATEATPFLRYRIGDVGTRSKTPCPCGRPGDVFLSVDGRTDDLVMTPDGRLVGRLDHIFKGQLDVREAQIVQETRDAIRVLVVPRKTFSAQSEAALRKEIRGRLGPEIRAEIRLVDAIPREPNGKFRAVKSRLTAEPASLPA